MTAIKNFLFLKKDDTPKVAANYCSMLTGLVKKYNKQNKEQLPHITPHILRHTFCTQLANAGMNPKALQYIMGHANISMTLNITPTQPTTQQRQKWKDWRHKNLLIYYCLTTFELKVIPKNTKIC